MADHPRMTTRKRKFLFAGGMVLVLASACLLAQNLPTSLPPTSTSTSVPTQLPATPTGSPIPTPAASGSLHTSSFPEIQRVPPEDAKAAQDSGSAVIVDVRSKASYDASHIPGALSIPLGELETRLNELDPKAWIITYCT
jgi:hypothetical protein